jgi:hypothetical protein
MMYVYVYWHSNERQEKEALTHSLTTLCASASANLIRLCESLSINRFNEQVAIYQRGVSSVANQPLTVVIPESNPGMAHLGKANNATNDGVVDADADSVTLHSALTTTVTLDQFAQDHGWYDLPDFTIPLLKLDIEGHEPNVVKGAKKLLCSGIIQNILTEFNQMERQLFRLLWTVGMSLSIKKGRRL